MHVLLLFWLKKVKLYIFGADCQSDLGCTGSYRLCQDQRTAGRADIIVTSKSTPSLTHFLSSSQFFVCGEHWLEIKYKTLHRGIVRDLAFIAPLLISFCWGDLTQDFGSRSVIRRVAIAAMNWSNDHSQHDTCGRIPAVWARIRWERNSLLMLMQIGQC